MSFCPNRDVHSIYIDNEMPRKYIAEYEAHVNTCPECQRQLAMMKAVKDIVKADSDDSAPEKVFDSDNYMEESYRRLMIKMAYNKNTNFSADKFNGNIKKGLLESLRYAIPTAVAAIVLAVILPVRSLNFNASASVAVSGENMDESSYSASVATVAPQSSVFPYTSSAVMAAPTPVSFNKDRGVVISGNIHESVLPVSNPTKSFAGQAIKNKVRKSDKNQSLMKNYEVFRPAFSDEKTISIRITVPAMDTNSVITEIELPYDMFTGYFE